MRFLNKDKRGMSAVIAMVILMALTIVVVGIIWAAISGLVETRTEKTGLCFNLYDKVTFNDELTCYDAAEGNVEFSINVGDVELDGILVGISTNTTGESFTITNKGGTIDYLTMYGGETNVVMPGKNSGKTYVFDLSAAGLAGNPSVVQVAPIISETTCEVTDTVQGIGAC